MTSATKRLCGDDVFSPSNPGFGSCDAASFSPLNRDLMIASAVLLGIAMVLPCGGGLVGGEEGLLRPAAVGTSIMRLLLFAASL
jgi:hypothetical protein